MFAYSNTLLPIISYKMFKLIVS